VARWGFRRLLTTRTGEIEVPPPPDVGGGMTGHRRNKKGKRRAAGEGVPLPDTFSSPPFFFPCVTLVRHSRHSARREAASGTSCVTLARHRRHSASDDRSWRNPHPFPSRPRREAASGTSNKTPLVSSCSFSCEIPSPKFNYSRINCKIKRRISLTVNKMQKITNLLTRDDFCGIFASKKR